MQTSTDCVSENRMIAASIDVESGRRTKVKESCPSEDMKIVVEAKVDGLGSTQITIDLSASAADLPAGVAERMHPDSFNLLAAYD